MRRKLASLATGWSPACGKPRGSPNNAIAGLAGEEEEEESAGAAKRGGGDKMFHCDEGPERHLQEDSQWQHLAESALLHVPEVFCRMASSGASPLEFFQGTLLPSAALPGAKSLCGSPHTLQLLQPSCGRHDVAEDLTVTCTVEWHPCGLALTEEALELAHGAQTPVPIGVTNGSSCEQPSASPRWRRCYRVPLECIIDVAPLESSEADLLSERSTFEGSLSAERALGVTSALDVALPRKGGGLTSAFGRSDGCSPKDILDEWLCNGVEVGTFELPPIPLAKLPQSKAGLPSEAAMKEAFELKLVKGAFRRPQSSASHGGVPLKEYDGSNCNAHQAYAAAIPPLPPGACRLPQRTHRELRSKRNHHDSSASNIDGAPFPHVLLVRIALSGTVAVKNSRGQGLPCQHGNTIAMCFTTAEDAARTRDVLLHSRATKLKRRAGDKLT